MTRTRALVLIGLLVALVLAGVASYYASSQPDGLEKVAADQGFDQQERSHSMAGSPLADYSLRGVDNDRLSGGAAGIAGVALTFALAGGVAFVVRRPGSASSASTDAVAAEEPSPTARP